MEIADAVRQMRLLLAMMDREKVGLDGFLPVIAADAPEQKRRCRAVMASTDFGGLELASSGGVMLAQTIGMGPIRM